MDRRMLTDRGIATLKAAPAGRRIEVFDTKVDRLLVRVTDRGQKSFVLFTRFPGAAGPARRRIGRVGKMSLDTARRKARHWLDMIERGLDPAEEEERERREAQERKANSFAQVAEQFIRRRVVGPAAYAGLRAGADRYMAAHPQEKMSRLQALAKVIDAGAVRPRARKAAVVIRELDREFVARWGARPITNISQRDIMKVIDAAVDRGAPYQARNLFGHVRAVFNWAIGCGTFGIDRSPCDRISPKEAIGKKESRKRVLSDAELWALWRAAGKMGYPNGPLFRLLLLTGQRKSEVANAAWPEFNLEKQRWEIPAERMKMDAAHVVPLADVAITHLRSLPRFKGDFLFTAITAKKNGKNYKEGRKPVNGFSNAKARLDRRMLHALRALARKRGEDPGRVEIRPFVIHDIRRTVRTHLAALPVAPLVAERVIAHAKQGLDSVYNLYEYEEEKRQALALWEKRLLNIVAPPGPPGNVVALRASGK